MLYIKNEWEKLLSKKQSGNNKERLREQARDKYRNLSEEEKDKMREYGKNRYHHMPEEKKKD